MIKEMEQRPTSGSRASESRAGGSQQPQGAVPRDVVTGIAAGAVGGLIGAWAMNQFHMLWSRASNALEERQSRPVEQMQQQRVQSQPSEGTSHVQEVRRTEQQSEQTPTDEPATVQAAERISEGVMGHPLSDEQKQVAGPLMHYSFGVAMGGFYGGAAELAPTITTGRGTLAGAILWAVSDEVVVPALRLSRPPTEHSPSAHASALAAHVVFGLTAETVRRFFRGR